MSSRKAAARRDRGQVAIEYMGFIPLLLLVGLCAIQLGVAAYTANQAGTAARAAARTASHEQPDMPARLAGEHAISGWLADGLDWDESYGFDTVTYTAHVEIPSVIPGLSWGKASRTSTMPRE
ncbi:pilus assembly protein [Streptomyces sp. A0642]|uniref:TadE/TadG family type IV pilus assembly protein n=1 Tax=Streptomyces sp. A0642 TaxID=2563100 RepID=UPI0010A2647C|nr:TadE/TadG family type IV pilus assembly protein [Streptomyces sp. A0642]THA73032.1 pilus assembly protein [Streptomyces sp. A0642]